MLRAVFLLLRNMSIVRLVTRLMLDRRVPFLNKLIIPAALAYFILPFDLMPDIVPLAGHIDDLLVVGGAVVLFLLMTPRDVLNEHLRGGPSQDPDRHQPDGPVIEGSYKLVDDEGEASK